MKYAVLAEEQNTSEVVMVKLSRVILAGNKMHLVCILLQSVYYGYVCFS